MMNPPPPPRLMTTIHRQLGARGVVLDHVSPPLLPPVRQVAVVSPPPNGPTSGGPRGTPPWIAPFVVRPRTNDDDDEDEGDLLLCLDEILSVSDDSLYGAGDDDDDEHEIAMTLCDA